MNKLIILFLITIVTSCSNIESEQTLNRSILPVEIPSGPFLIVLGTIQDAGSPHIGCAKSCCTELFETPVTNRKVVSLGIVDPENKQSWLFEATPDLPEQMKLLKKYSTFSNSETPNGILLTHAHIGHYTGLMYLGREAMNTQKLTVYAMPGMKTFLETNGPWSQLVDIENILIAQLQENTSVPLSSNFSVTPILVPHRDEYAETVGYRIDGPKKKVLFIPDIDKWHKWNKDIIDEIRKVDYAFLDATFYDAVEINNRDISEIPHPFIIESIELFRSLPNSEKEKIHFIHFNHTNPVINPESSQAKKVLSSGFNIARFEQLLEL